MLHTAWRLSLERASERSATKATKSVPDKAQTAARLNTWRGFATPYGADSRRLFVPGSMKHYTRETLIKYRTVRCVRGGWMQAPGGSQAWKLGNERRAADAAPDATRRYDGALEGPALWPQARNSARKGYFRAFVLAQGGAGSSWCRPATRRPRRLALGQNRSVARRET